MPSLGEDPGDTSQTGSIRDMSFKDITVRQDQGIGVSFKIFILSILDYDRQLEEIVSSFLWAKVIGLVFLKARVMETDLFLHDDLLSCRQRIGS